VIRVAMPSDAAPLAALLRALNDEPGLRPELISAESVARDLIGDPRALVLLAELDGVPKGVATAHPAYDSGQSRWGLFLNDLFVAPEARRRGLGRALIAALAAHALSTDCRFLWWNADEGDELAFLFHRSLGAEELRVTDFLLAGASFERLAREHAR
jgi:GNAT superfamily N-acetyltransferase